MAGMIFLCLNCIFRIMASSLLDTLRRLSLNGFKEELRWKERITGIFQEVRNISNMDFKGIVFSLVALVIIERPCKEVVPNAWVKIRLQV